jgi:hypothetical protein
MKRELEETGLFQVTVVSATGGRHFSNVHPDFAKYRVMVSNYDSQDWPAALKAVEAYIKWRRAGGGAWRRQCLPDWAAFNR